jgi:FkbM family methyltransferase
MVPGLAKKIARPLIATVAAPLTGPVGAMALWAAGMATLKRAGFAPRTVFDIGVATGTPELYEAFPEAHFVLVDPSRDSFPHMQRLADGLDAEIHAVALGDRDGEVEIETRRDDIAGATLFKELGPVGETERYAVPLRRFDSLFTGFARPALCKIDVQGAELMALEGMGERMRDIDALIVEASTIPTLADAPELFEVLAFLNQRGFVVYDLVGMAHRPLDGALAQLDLLCVPVDSPLRADHRWRATL